MCVCVFWSTQEKKKTPKCTVPALSNQTCSIFGQGVPCPVLRAPWIHNAKTTDTKEKSSRLRAQSKRSSRARTETSHAPWPQSLSAVPAHIKITRCVVYIREAVTQKREQIKTKNSL